MFTFDMKKAFLKGVAYEELAALTCETKRKVNFEITTETAAILKTIPGFEHFDHRRDILRNLKPGTGTKTHLDVSA